MKRKKMTLACSFTYNLHFVGFFLLVWSRLLTPHARSSRHYRVVEWLRREIRVTLTILQTSLYQELHIFNSHMPGASQETEKKYLKIQKS